MPLPDPPSWHILQFDAALLSTVEAFRHLERIVAGEERPGERLLIVVEGGSSPEAAPCRRYVDELAPALLDGTLPALYHDDAQARCRLTAQTNDSHAARRTTTLAGLLAGYLLNGTRAGTLFTDASDFESLTDWPANGIPVVAAANPPNAVGRTSLLLVRALAAGRLTWWTRQGGILSADPAPAPAARVIPRLSLREAAEIALWNHGILSPGMLIPLQDLDVAWRIASFRDPPAPGTIIGRTSAETTYPAKAVTGQDNLCLLVIEGFGMKGVAGLMAGALGALAAEGINIVMLSQAATEQSAGIVIDHAEKARGLDILRRRFADDIASGAIRRVYALDPVGVVTAVDDHMRYRPGITGRMFSTFGRSGINVLTIADGASENNISAVVDEADLPAAVQALHEAFCLGRRRAHVFLFGTGTIGRQLLELMHRQSDAWLDTLNLHLCLVGIANSRRMLWDTRGIPFDEALEKLDDATHPRDLEAIVRHLAGSRLDRLIVIDATASSEIARLYPVLFEHNIAVVTPNKRANTLDYAFYDRLHRTAREHQVPFFYETTVGAGLPIISTLRDLIRSGDEIIRIEGILSGTLAFLFNGMARGLSFGQALREAYENGFTEPDPRDDLSGIDVARKMLTLAREMGLRLERKDVELEPLLDEELLVMPREVFVADMEDLLAGWTPPNTGDRLQYIGVIENGAIRIGIRPVDEASPLAWLQGADNLVAFTTRRYRHNPLVVQGPGAGPAVTAGGVLADVIRAAELVT